MSSDPQATTIDPAAIDAVIFDLDGVITDTAAVHLEAWTRMFNGFLEQHAGDGDHEPFTEEDYLRYVDGRPRYDGVRTFLQSRSIELPEGEPSDSSDALTVCGLGNRKNDDFRRAVAEGIQPYPTSVTLVETLLAAGVRTALVSSSRNAGSVLEAAGLGHLFEAGERMGMLGTDEHLVLVVGLRVADPDPQHEAVELRLRQREGALQFDRVLGRQDEKRATERHRLALARDRPLLHGLQQRRLGAR